MSQCNKPPAEEPVPEPRDFLADLVDRMIRLSVEPTARALDYTRLMDECRQPGGKVPSLPPGVIAREEFHALVEVVLVVREDLGIEAEQAWVAVRYEGRPVPEVAGEMRLPASHVRELCLLWEYAVLAALGQTHSPTSPVP